MKWILILCAILFTGCENQKKSLSLKEILEKTEQLKSLPSYCYPYVGLEKSLEREGKTHLVLFSYGSLINKTSASRTLSKNALASFRPALGLGLRRVFDRDVPIKPQSRWGIPCDPSARGMLNVHRTAAAEEFVNGIIINLPLEDIPALLEREEGYDLIPIIALDWSSFLAGQLKFCVAYTLSAKPPFTNSHIFPRPGYFELARDSASEFGPLFTLLWYNTTYLADEKTLISAWEDCPENRKIQTKE